MKYVSLSTTNAVYENATFKHVTVCQGNIWILKPSYVILIGYDFQLLIESECFAVSNSYSNKSIHDTE